MKVVLFCGGLGLRMRDYSEEIPKPMVTIGSRPILWHVMKYYAYFGHTDFILCLGHRGEKIRAYFDHVMDNEVRQWNITLVDTGDSATIGERLMAVRSYLDDEDMFLANYSDGLTDLPLPEYVARFSDQGKTGCFVCVKTPQTFHVVELANDRTVTGIVPIRDSDIWINGGFFVFRREIFQYMATGEDLVAEPFERLISAGELVAYKYDGFWAAMDTFKDRATLEAMHRADTAPWRLWPSDRAVGASVNDVAR